MVMMNLEAKQVGETVQVLMDILGERNHLQITAEGPNLYEAVGRCIAKLMQEQGYRQNLKVTWVRCRPQLEECTVIQELREGSPVRVRWGISLFADLFEPVYTYLKNL